MQHYLLGIVAATAILTGCETKTQTGALVGGGLGAGTGALIAGPQGALIGGAAGVIGGAVIGASLDDADRENVQRENSRTLKRVDNGEQLSVHDIISLHKAGVSDTKIIELIQKTNSRYNLTTYKIERLHNAGVSDTVINYMMNT